MGGQALHVAEIIGNICQFERVHETECHFLTAVELERHEGPAISHLLFSQGMDRMICQSRVVNLSDPRVIHEKRRDLMGVRGLALNPQIQCLQSFQYKPGVERTERRAGMPQDVGKLFLNDFTVTKKRAS